MWLAPTFKIGPLGRVRWDEKGGTFVSTPITPPGPIAIPRPYNPTTYRSLPHHPTTPLLPPPHHLIPTSPLHHHHLHHHYFSASNNDIYQLIEVIQRYSALLTEVSSHLAEEARPANAVIKVNV